VPQGTPWGFLGLPGGGQGEGGPSLEIRVAIQDPCRMPPGAVALKWRNELSSGCLLWKNVYSGPLPVF